jgi:tetratricopeptide (TPR) repeat protein
VPGGVSYTLTATMRILLAGLLAFSSVASAWARDTSEHWLEVKSTHFDVITDSNEKQARKVASQFERMRAVFHTILPSASDSAGSAIVVVALKDRKAFQTLEPEAYLAKGQLDLAGVFLRAPDKSYILLRLDAEGDHPYATVYHEYTHYMLRTTEDWMPLWLNEGLAEFYQNSEIRDKAVLVGQPSTNDILYLRQNRLLPLKTLLMVDHESPYYHQEQKGSVFYAESWALAHYIQMSDAQKGTSHLRDYAALLIKKQDAVAAAQHVFGDIDQLQRSLDSYISQGVFMEFKLTAPVQFDETAFTVTALPTPDADAIRADVLVYNQRNKDALALLATSLRDDPKSALAHETMGYLKFREGDLPAAAKWYGEAVQLDSQSYLAHYYYAAMSMQSLDHDHDAQIESSLQTAIKLNPGFAPSYDSLAMFYGMRREKLPEAHMLNLQALELEPENLNYRMNTASILAQEEQYISALGVLKAARKVAKTPDQLALVEDRIAAMEKYQEAEKARDRSEQAASDGASPGEVKVFTNTNNQHPHLAAQQDDAAKYPTEEPGKVRHTVQGVIHGVKCSYPSIITLSVNQAGRMVNLYRNDFFKIEFTAANFTPVKDIDPCHGIDGMKARVAYAEVSDKTVAGQILSIELSR